MDVVGTKTSDDRNRVLYGSPDGHWALLECRTDTAPPVGLDVEVGCGQMWLTNLGTPVEVIRMAYRCVPTRGARTMIANVLGVSRRTVGRYLDGDVEPRPRADGWTDLVRTYFILRTGAS
jgi:hypothetical protein